MMRFSKTLEGQTVEPPLSEDGLMDLVEEITAALQQGDTIDMDLYCQRHPAYAERLRGIISAMTAMTELSGPLDSGARGSRSARLSEDPIPGTLGDFRIFRELGRGGMGMVYEAEQISLARAVAVKVLPFAAMLDKQQLARFKNEARAAATLDHPNIVSVYAVGFDRGVHYYAMQLVVGYSLAQLIEQLRDARSASAGNGVAHASADTQPAAILSTFPGCDGRDYYRSVAQLGIQAAEALEHAHQHGILHRDIKPGNLLIDHFCKLCITDFGLARIEADTGITMSGDLVGTLRYMSPEQALAKNALVDQRSDIYGLGATLYELLALHPPFAESDREILLRKIASEDPRPLRKIDVRIPADLETIVGKALEKNPTDRYQSARQLGDDLRAYLENRPIKAKPPTLTNRAMKWSQRHIGIVWSAATILLIGMAALTTSTAFIARSLSQVRQALGEVAIERDAGYRNLYVAQMRVAQECWRQGDVSTMQSLLDEHLPQTGRNDRRGWEWYYLQSLPAQEELVFLGHADYRDAKGVSAVAWRPDGKYVASTAYNTNERCGEIKIWDPKNGAVVKTIRQLKRPSFLSWSPDGQRLATSQGPTIAIWDSNTGQLQLEIDRGFGDNCEFAWDPSGQRITGSGPDHAVVVWDANSGKALKHLVGYPADVFRTAWSPDGNAIAATGYDSGRMTVWGVEAEHMRLSSVCNGRGCLPGLDWSPDSARIAVGSDDGMAIVWNATSGVEQLALPHASAVRQVAFSPDGKRLATSDGDRVIVWNAQTGESESRLQGHFHGINSLAWSPDGKRILTGAGDGLAKIWEMDRDASIIAKHVEFMGPRAWSPDDRQLAYGTVDKSIVICDVKTGRRRHVLEGSTRLTLEGLCWNSDGRFLACPGSDGTIRVWDVVAGTIVNNWTHDPQQKPVEDGYELVSLSWHPNGWQLASMSDTDGTVRIWDARSAQLIDSFTSGVGSRGWEYDQCVAWSPDGKRLATMGIYDGLQIWDVASWKKLLSVNIQRDVPTWSVAWSPDGQYLAVGSNINASPDKPLQVLNSRNGKAVCIIVGSKGSCGLEWSADGRRLMTCDPGGTWIWDAMTGEQMLRIDGRTRAAWSHDQKRIAVLDHGQVRIHDASRGFEMAATANHVRYRAREHAARGLGMNTVGMVAQAGRQIEVATSMAPLDPIVLARAAWFFASCNDDQIRERNRSRAHELARSAKKGIRDAGIRWGALGIALGNIHDDICAKEKLNLALQLTPTDPEVQAWAAYHLETCTDPSIRDPHRALDLAQKAIQSAPNSSYGWQALGWALYRNGNWSASVEALEKSMELQGNGGDPWQWYFLAMAHARMNEPQRARAWFDKSVRFPGGTTNGELQSFYCEAAALLGITPDLAVVE